MIRKLIMFITATIFIITTYLLSMIIPGLINYKNAPSYMKIKCPTGSICIQNPNSIK